MASAKEMIDYGFAYEVFDFDGRSGTRSEAERRILKPTHAWRSEAALQRFVERHAQALLGWSHRLHVVHRGMAGKGFSDLLLIDGAGSIVVVEAKKGTINGGAIGQLHGYISLLAGCRSTGALLDTFAEHPTVLPNALGVTASDRFRHCVAVAVGRNVSGSGRRLLSHLGTQPWATESAPFTVEYRAWGLGGTRFGGAKRKLDTGGKGACKHQNFQLVEYLPSPESVPRATEATQGDVIADEEWIHTDAEGLRVVENKEPNGVLRVRPVRQHGDGFRRTGKVSELRDAWRWVVVGRDQSSD